VRTGLFLCSDPRSRYFAPCRITTHSPEPAILLDEPALLLVVPDEPDCIETEGPFGPMLVVPLSPPGPL